MKDAQQVTLLDFTSKEGSGAAATSQSFQQQAASGGAANTSSKHHYTSRSQNGRGPAAVDSTSTTSTSGGKRAPNLANFQYVMFIDSNRLDGLSQPDVLAERTKLLE